MRSGDQRSAGGGLVRAARRPRGWTAPGPEPTGVLEPPGPGEDLCYLSGNWRIYQRLDGHRWSLDDLVTAAVASDTDDRPSRIIDLGCGIGSVLLMLAWSFPEARLVGIEAQALSVDLCRRSVRMNGVEARVEVRSGDIRNTQLLEAPGRFDLVTGTPPYFPPSDGVLSDRPQKGACRFELRGGVEAYFTAGAHCLNGGGRFVLCADARQRARVEAAAQHEGLSVQLRLDVIPKAGKPALFSVFSCTRQPVALRSEELVVRRRDGRRTEAFVALRARMGLPP